MTTPRTVAATGVSASLAAQLRRLVKTVGADAAVTAAIRDALDAHATVKHAARKGRTRSTPRGSKAKGRHGVLAVRAWLLETLGCHEDDIVVQTTSVGGSDLQISPAASVRFPFAPEVKNVQSLNVWEALAQADVNATKRGKPPILFIMRNGTPLHVVVRADLFAPYIRQRGV